MVQKEFIGDDDYDLFENNIENNSEYLKWFGTELDFVF